MSTANISQDELDKLNAEFWNEPCGTYLARSTRTQNNFQAFDKEYFKQYPFLIPYLAKFGGKVIEIGTGYGTVSAYLDRLSFEFVGCDLSDGPIDILTRRLIYSWKCNVLDLPHQWIETFDGVVSIGCLHHTGNIPKALSEIHRVLKPGGRALIMLYNVEAEKPSVDKDTHGNKAPFTEYTHVDDLPRLFKAFSSWRYDLQNGKHKDIYIEAIK